MLIYCWHGSMINCNNTDDMHWPSVHFHSFVKAKKCHFCKGWFNCRTRNNDMIKKKHQLSWSTFIECMWDKYIYYWVPIMCVWTHQHFSSKRIMDLFFFKMNFIDLPVFHLVHHLFLCFFSCRFILHFISQGSLNGERTTCTLNVIETNPFKHLTHLSLKFIPGTDSDIKKYLADCLKQFKV